MKEGRGVEYDHKVYWGKTGRSGFTFWEYGPGWANAQGDLAWWDVCPYQVEGRWLVLKKSYTLPPQRLARLFDIFCDVPDRYRNFGLHIDTAIKGWGCLSNVGLAMEDIGLEPTLPACRFERNCPTTLNRSVWRVIMGTQSTFASQRKAGLKIIDSVAQIVLDENKGRAWGDSVPISDQEDASMGMLLLDVLKGHVVPQVNGELKIESESHLHLENGICDRLDYYDPGLFPPVFGENPADSLQLGGAW